NSLGGAGCLLRPGGEVEFELAWMAFAPPWRAYNFAISTLHLNRAKIHRCAASRGSTPIITPPTWLIAASCGVFEIIWSRAVPMASASGIRQMSVWVLDIAGCQSSTSPSAAPADEKCGRQTRRHL